MKATTKFQIEIVSLTKKLQPLSMAHENWAIENCIQHISTCNSKNQITCLHCANVYKDILFTESKTVCPSCNITATKKILTKRRIFDDWSIFAIYDTIKQLQVIRYFKIDAKFKKGLKAEYIIREVSQLWLSPDGKFDIYANQHQLNYYQNRWIGGFEIRNKRSLEKYDIKPYKVYPKIKLIKEFKRVKFKLADSNLTPLTTFKRLLKPAFETLYKSKQIDVFNFHNEYKVITYWQSIRICLRNNYLIERADIYFDYLDLLKHFNKDLANAKYVCPVDLEYEHDRLVKKKNEIFRRKKLEEQKQLIEEEQIKYFENKSKYFDLKISNEEICITPIKHVKDFYLIGSEQEHCIFTNGYYKRENSLILVAYNKQNIILETIELSLKDFQISQSYGRKNKITPYHDTIKNLINSNINYIKNNIAS